MPHRERVDMGISQLAGLETLARLKPGEAGGEASGKRTSIEGVGWGWGGGGLRGGGGGGQSVTGGMGDMGCWGANW